MLRRMLFGMLALLIVSGAAGAFGYQGQLGTTQALAMPGNGSSDCAPNGCASLGANEAYLVHVDEASTEATACTSNGGAPGSTQDGSFTDGGATEAGTHNEDGGCVTVDGSAPAVAASLHGTTRVGGPVGPEVEVVRASAGSANLGAVHVQAGATTLVDGATQAAADGAGATAYDFASTNACLRSSGAEGIVLAFFGLHPSDCPDAL